MAEKSNLRENSNLPKKLTLRSCIEIVTEGIVSSILFFCVLLCGVVVSFGVGVVNVLSRGE